MEDEQYIIKHKKSKTNCVIRHDTVNNLNVSIDNKVFFSCQNDEYKEVDPLLFNNLPIKKSCKHLNKHLRNNKTFEIKMNKLIGRKNDSLN